MPNPLVQSTGRRKQAVARVRLRPGQGAIKVNGRTIEDYFPSATHRMIITEPLRMIAENAGEEGAIVLGKVTEAKDANFGFNAFSGEYEDLVKAGVLDPTKVVRTALTNAGSIASLMLTTEALVAEIPEEKKNAPMPGGHGGGMEGMY